MTSVLCEGVIVKRSGLVEGVSKLRMTVPTTESISNDVGVTGREYGVLAAQNREGRRRTISRVGTTE